MGPRARNMPAAPTRRHTDAPTPTPTPTRSDCRLLLHVILHTSGAPASWRLLLQQGSDGTCGRPPLPPPPPLPGAGADVDAMPRPIAAGMFPPNSFFIILNYARQSSNHYTSCERGSFSMGALRSCCYRCHRVFLCSTHNTNSGTWLIFASCPSLFHDALHTVVYCSTWGDEQTKSNRPPPTRC